MSGPEADLAGSPVLVTGGTGFLGAYVVPRLLAAGCQVTVVGADAGWREPVRRLIGAGAVRLVAEEEWWRAGATRRIARAARDAEHLVHLAYTPPPQAADRAARHRHEIRVNLGGTVALLGALGPRLRHVVLASSVKVYGGSPPCPVDEGTPAEPDDAYGAAKLAAEGQLRALCADGGPAVTALRLTTLYGAMETVPRAVPNFVRAGLAGGPATIRGAGTERRDHLHVSDAAELVLRAFVRPPAGFRIVVGGTGTGVRTVDLAERVRQAIVRHGVRLPPPARHVDAAPVADLVCRTAGAVEELGFLATVGLDRGLADEVAWFLARPELWRPAPVSGSQLPR